LINNVYSNKKQRGATHVHRKYIRDPYSEEKEVHKSRNSEKLEIVGVGQATLHENGVCNTNFFK
jgi:hypothetical protein